MGLFHGKRSPEKRAERKVSSNVKLVLDAVAWDKDGQGLEPPYYIMVGECPETLSSQDYMRRIGKAAVLKELFALNLDYDEDLSFLASTSVGTPDQPFRLKNNLWVVMNHSEDIYDRVVSTLDVFGPASLPEHLG
jgi:hypothetical protein